MRHTSGPPSWVGFLRFSAWSIVAVAITGCDNPSELDVHTEPVLMYGRVVNDAGAAVAGARVTVTQHAGLCSMRAVEEGSNTSGADGRYRVTLPMRISGQSCVHLHFQAPNHATEAISRIDVQYRDGVLPPDSVETNAVLRRT